ATCRSRRFIEQGRVRHRLDPAAAGAARAAIGSFSPDAIMAFDILAAWVAAPIAARRIAWLGDLAFQSIWHHALYSARENPRAVLHVPSNWLCCRTWQRLYGTVLRETDQVICASHSSVASLAALGIAAEYEPYPWPEPGAEAVRARPLSETPTFLFFGTLTGLGSRSALHFTLEKVFPRLRRLWGEGGFRILLAGRGAVPGWAERMMAGKPEFERLGFVADLDAVMASCHAVLVPIDVPVGNRSRILTAMAKRTLVIAHQNTALGNPDLVDGETAYLSGDAPGFVERMRQAVADRRRADVIIARAFACWRDKFHPEAAGARLATRIAALIEPTSFPTGASR
ncbi:MAG: glycosyltransferase family 4 protein, partial [Alphaproteobacteria bacterium]|nr:glycosyltransferase family 4 protein [Alphaproteobacteria bacterium]